MRFPYFQLGPNDFAPIIPLKIFGETGNFDFEAYIDSGASISIFNTNRAEILGIDFTKGRKVYLTVGDGGQIEVFVHRLKVKLGQQKFIADVGFSKQLGVGFNLLGRQGFFDRFRICFDDKNRFVELHSI